MERRGQEVAPDVGGREGCCESCGVVLAGPRWKSRVCLDTAGFLLSWRIVVFLFVGLLQKSRKQHR